MKRSELLKSFKQQIKSIEAFGNLKVQNTRQKPQTNNSPAITFYVVDENIETEGVNLDVQEREMIINLVVWIQNNGVDFEKIEEDLDKYTETVENNLKSPELATDMKQLAVNFGVAEDSNNKLYGSTITYSLQYTKKIETTQSIWAES